MKFQKNSRRKSIVYEKDLVGYWQKIQAFEQSVERRPKEDAYIFYDGPPFITGLPHAGTLLSSIIKDAVPRYQTMKGKRVERVWGWDCHGLPAEVFTEKKLGIKDKRDIGTKVSLEDYIITCRDNIVQTGSEWEDTIERIGRWVNFSGAYKTMDKDYMESVWWAFKQLYDAGKIYEGEKVLLYCIRDATPISKAEVAMDNSYQDDTDPSVYVKFKLANENVYLLAWTTTPWTLPSNTALAVNKDIDYVEVEVNNERLILAKALIEKALQDEHHNVVSYTIIKTFKGEELIGKHYEPLFENRGENAHKIWHADFIHVDEGTGIAHESPAYGEEDYELSKLHKFPMVLDTDEEGFYTEGEWAGRQIWEVNKEIAKTLHERGVVQRIDYITHSYPHCHRCGTKLMYRAHPSWFMDIDTQRQQMLELNENINWFPGHIKHGRFEKTVESAPDWNISRDRFWATAMPIWKGTDENGQEHVKVVGSYAELKGLSGVELNDYHRPWIDEVEFDFEGVHYKRIDKVLDCWFESGSMPFAQFHYPFENKDKFDQNRQADFIAEYVAQVRAWFYYLHAVSTGLFDQNTFKNVIVTGTLAGNDGRKMSKSFNNFTDPNVLMDEYSADALRFLMLSSPVLNGEDYSLQDKDVADVNRKLGMIWNMYDFFTLYAEVDNWQWNDSLDDPSSNLNNVLDKWIVSRVHQLAKEVDEHMQRYDIPNALKPVLPFIDDASNWYVRRSRRRFWKSEDDNDKNQAYQTLHYVLVYLSIILAPFTPFLAEELFLKLTGGQLGESVHWLDWPKAAEIDKQLLLDMDYVRGTITLGLAKRSEHGLKVRQPLAKVTVFNALLDNQQAANFKDIIKEELNVKEIEVKRTGDLSTTERQEMLKQSGYCSQNGDQVELLLDLELTPELKREGMMREAVRLIQNERKQAKLDVDDRIKLSFSTPDEQLRQAINEHHDTIAAETLATELTFDQTFAHQVEQVIDDAPLTISLEKV